MSEKQPIGIIGKKLGMSQVFDENGNRFAVTVVQAGPCTITQTKTPEKDGYHAVQLGFDERKEKSTTKALAGHFKKANTTPKRQVVEFRIRPQQAEGFEVGKQIDSSVFSTGDIIDVAGLSKGRGFAGVMKRYNFKGQSRTHGTHEAFRHGGSIGCAFPQHVAKGRKMPGRMGGERVTLQNLQIVDIKPADNLIYVKGAIPGAKGDYVTLSLAKKTYPSVQNV